VILRGAGAAFQMTRTDEARRTRHVFAVSSWANCAVSFRQLAGKELGSRELARERLLDHVDGSLGFSRGRGGRRNLCILRRFEPPTPKLPAER